MQVSPGGTQTSYWTFTAGSSGFLNTFTIAVRSSGAATTNTPCTSKLYAITADPNAVTPNTLSAIGTLLQTIGPQNVDFPVSTGAPSNIDFTGWSTFLTSGNKYLLSLSCNSVLAQYSSTAAPYTNALGYTVGLFGTYSNASPNTFLSASSLSADPTALNVLVDPAVVGMRDNIFYVTELMTLLEKKCSASLIFFDLFEKERDTHFFSDVVE